MKIILNSVRHTELDPIVIDVAVFPIGRKVQPFDTIDAELNKELSRAHAKIFQEEGVAYLVDLGSLNGTTLNGDSVGSEPVRICNEDIIGLGKQLLFKVIIEGEVETDATMLIDPQSTVRLTLKPKNLSSDLEALVINRFPFLVSKSEGVFSDYADNLLHQHELKLISRRHAYFFIDHDEVRVEDLGSTNGSFVNGERLSDQARVLRQGDEISFGGEYFSYEVRLEDPQLVDSDIHQQADATLIFPQQDPTEIPGKETQPAYPEMNRTETIYVNDAHPFLEIFCNKDEDTEDEPDCKNPVKQNAVASAKKPDIQSLAKPSLFKKIRTFFSEFIKALSDGDSAHKRHPHGLIFFIIIALLAGSSALLYHLDSEEKAIKKMIKAGRFEEAVTLSSEYVSRFPQNDNVQQLATTAALNLVVPLWQTHLSEKRFVQAEAVLVQAVDQHQSNPDMLQNLELMAWVGKLEKYMAAHQGVPEVALFKEENTIPEIVEWWQKDEKQYNQQLSLIAQTVPSFKSLFTQTLSHVRTLKHEHNTDIAAMASFKQSLAEKLSHDGQEAELSGMISEFAKKYPTIVGTQALETDLLQYLKLKKIIDEQDLEQILIMRQQVDFKTPLFHDKATQLLAEKLPVDAVVNQYQEVSSAWREGNTDQAIRVLQGLVNESWGDTAKGKLEHYQRVLNDYKALDAKRDSPEFSEYLFNFRSGLSSTEDTYFLELTDTDFHQYQQQVLNASEAKITSAQRQWNQYTRKGGISGLLRMEERVSKQYKQRAKYLLAAYQDIRFSINLYASLQMAVPPSWSELHDEIIREMDKQRKWLKQLERVLDPSLLNKKLQLLGLSRE